MMNVNAALAELCAGIKQLEAQREGNEMSTGAYVDVVDRICDAATALDSSMRAGRTPPMARLGLAWLGKHESQLVKSHKGLLRDVEEILERQGEKWWDETVTSGLHHRQLAEKSDTTRDESPCG
ncbi:MAG: hypothetical protein NXI31_06010 [bacterium]|nr:hypothetical protein [bacterium]